MNNSVPRWNFEIDTTCATTNQKKKPTVMDQELVELLWQNGQVVLNSQTHRKPSVNSIESRQVHQKNFQSTLRTSEPFGSSSNMVQDDETVSWIQYPIEDQFEQELCSNLLSELPPCEAESYSQIKQFEEGKFSKLEASRSSNNVTANSQSPNMRPYSSVQELHGTPMPAPRFHASDSSQKINGLGGSHKVMNLSHFFSTPHNANFTGKGAGSPSKSEVREFSGMTVGSSYCGSNHIPQDQGMSRASSNAAWGTTLSAEPEALRDDDTHIKVPQSDKGKSEMLEPNITSSTSGDSDSSFGKTCSLSTRNHGQKRKGIDAEESEEQSEDTELKSGVGNKASQRAGSLRRNRAAEVHNLSERRRRDRINEKMRALQQLIPHSSKTDKASMLEEAIEYLKSLQLQLQVMWMGSGMAPVMFPGIQHYASQMGMGMAAPSFPPIQNPMQLPRVQLDQSLPVSQTPNQTLMCQSPILGAFNYQNHMQNPPLSEQYARYLGYHLMQNSPQLQMNALRYGSQPVQHSQQTMVAPNNSSGPMGGAGGAANIDDAVSGKIG